MSNAHLIVSAATHLFAQRGFVGTSLRDLASHLSLAMGTVYRHFRTKDDLLAAIVLPYAAAVAAVIKANADARGAEHCTADLVQDLVQLRMRNPALGAIMNDPAVRNHETMGPVVAELDASMTKAISSGHESSEADSRAAIVVALINNVGNTLAVPRQVADQKKLQQTVCDAAADILR